MAIKIKFDSAHNAQSPTYLLTTRNGRIIGKLPATDIIFKDSFSSYSEVFFRVNKVDCTSDKWNQLVDFKLMFCPEYNKVYELYVKTDESDGLVKSVTAKSLGEAELSQINLYGIEINTESDISREDYKPTVLYDKNDPKASLLNRITEKTPHYTIDHVDSSIANIQRTFSFDGLPIYDAFQKISEEINCLFDINVTLDRDGNMYRAISVYDLEAYCVECGHREEFSGSCPNCGSTNVLPGYGKDTAIFVSTNSLAENIQYSTNSDSVKNCFKLTAGDDLMTATIVNCNPNGTGYIWFISDEVKKDMSAELVGKLNEYDVSYDYYQKEHRIEIPQEFITRYNTLIDKYNKYSSSLNKLQQSIVGYPALMNAYYNTIDLYLFLNSELMPSVEMQNTTAAKEISKLNAENLSPVAVQDIRKVSVATASSSVLAMAKTIVDSRYQVKIKDSSLSGTTWIGTFVVTNYSDDQDTATSSQVAIEVNDDYECFVKQKIDKSLHKSSDQVANIDAIFKLEQNMFTAELKKYSLSRLTAFHDACQACIDILIEQGIADKDSWASKAKNLYETIYIPYYNKLSVIDGEIKIRESEISVIVGEYGKDDRLVSDGIQTILEKERNTVQNALDFQKYLGEKLWLEFSAYRREDTYQNDNYISDGLNNAELFDRALEFINVAKKEIFKSATLQHSITASLKNLLVMKEFEPIVNNFEVGNWIRIRIDENIYKLRILEYEIDYENLENIAIVFSDVKVTSTGLSDAESVLSKASSMASSYGSVARQASQGNKGSNQISDWVNKGLALTKMKIVDSAGNQNIIWDSHGLLCREYLPVTDNYDDKQLKIINRGLYLTNDNWRTSRAGIGNFTFYNPMTGKMEESYGVIADTIVGNIVLSEKVGVFSKDNSITLGENGLVITTDKLVGGTVGDPLFTIQKNETDSDGHISTKKLFYINDNGELVINGDVQITSGSSAPGSLSGAISGMNDAIATNADAISKINVDSGKIQLQVQSSINRVTILYALSDSPTKAPSGEWSEVPPTNDGTRYMWQKTITATNDGNVTESVVCIQGAAGKDGDGRTSYIHIKYSDDGGITFTPGDESQGIADGETPGRYIGQYTSFVEEDSGNPSDYKWALIKGSDGNNGVGVASIVIKYAVSSQGKTPPNSGWLDNMPTVNDGQYLWVKTIISYTDGRSPSTSYSISKNGANGHTGNGVRDATFSYATSNDGSVPPTFGWSSTIPYIRDGQYLWTRIVLNYTNGTQSEPTYTVGKNGTDGKDGVSGQTSYIHIKYSNDGGRTFTPADDAHGIPAGETPGKYIGQYTSFDEFDSTNPTDYKWALIKGSDGQNGSDGVGVAGITTQYATSSQGTTPPSSGWVNSIPTVQNGRYLWIKTTITYTDGRPPTVSYSISKNGLDGYNGHDGNGVVDATISYAVSYSGTTPPSSGWQSTIPVMNEGQYLWTRIVLNYTNGGHSTPTYSVSRNGRDGHDGLDGVGVQKVITQYYFSTSDTMQSGGSWSDNSSGWSSGKFVWTRTKTIMTDGSITYSDPIYNKTITDALNGVEENDNRLTVLDRTISDLSVNTQDISASVEHLRKTTDANASSIRDDLLTIKNSVDSKMTSEEVTLEIKKEIAYGVGKVATSTGFTFDERGLRVTKSGSEMETLVTENGMSVSQNGEKVLTANNQGVDAKNLHATTYLIVGKNSRFEDYDNGTRTGCFWIGA